MGDLTDDQIREMFFRPRQGPPVPASAAARPPSGALNPSDLPALPPEATRSPRIDAALNAIRNGQRQRTPVVTGGAAANSELPGPGPEPPPPPPETGDPAAAPAPAEGGEGSLMDLLRSQTRSQTAPQGGANIDQQLMDFGGAMARGTSPHFAQNFGAGLQGLQQGRDTRLQQLRQGAELDVTAQYRQATVALERAKQAYEQDPTNPRNVLALRQAEYYAARAVEALRPPTTGSGSGGGRPGTGVMLVGPNGENRMHYPLRDGQDIPPGWRLVQDVRRETPTARTQINDRVTAARTRLRVLTDDPTRAYGPEATAARIELMEATRAQGTAPAAPGAAAPAPAAAPNVTVRPWSGSR